MLIGRRVTRGLLPLVAGGAVLFGIATPAMASTVGVSGDALVFTAGPGEANNAEVEGGGGIPFTVEDLGAALTPGPGCTALGPHRVRCPSVGVGSISFDTGDGADIVIVNSAVPSTVKGGCSNDVIEGGSSADRLIGDPMGCPQPGNDSLDGRDGNDVIFGGPGSDTFKGGSGDDLILARDGVADNVTCGTGRDSVRADLLDTVASDCERVGT
jgi:Ca2+-binding RTX toxin-like protein